MSECLLRCDPLVGVDAEHLLYDVVELGIARTHYFFEVLLMSHMTGFGGWEAARILQESVLCEVRRVLGHHFLWDMPTDVLHEAQVLVCVVHREQQV